MADEESPLLKALPPATDYITYLTVIEYNLSPENLPILHHVLQDTKLTTNIGWDLVHLLVPLLPASEQCLHDIARLGNPREVILKVTESLRLLEFDGVETNDKDDDQIVLGAPEGSKHPNKTAPVHEGSSGGQTSQMAELPPPLPLPVEQFVSLLSMLSTLQARIKTKHPSRFLSTTLQAVLAAFSHAESHREELIVAIVRTVKAVSGVKRPVLPSRKSSGSLIRVTSHPDPVAQGPVDPEAEAGIGSSPDESAMQTKLLQAFVTHVIEEYMTGLSEDQAAGLAWSSRLMEKMYPERSIPNSKTWAKRFDEDELLARRVDAVGQLVALGHDLKVSDQDLLQALVAEEQAMTGHHGEEEDAPATAEDIPLSRLGSLYLYTARAVSSILYDTPLESVTKFRIFREHHNVLRHCISSPSPDGGSTLGSEPAALIDAVLALGIICLEEDRVGNPSEEAFTEYLQVTALLSSNCPNPVLRGQAHYLTSTVLRSQPSDTARLTFIRDTLEHCPFENLKVSAVGWIKGETIEANPPIPVPSPDAHTHEDAVSDDPSVFATPVALDSLAPFLFRSLAPELVTSPLEDAWATFNTGLSFYLAVLNFLYLLLSAKHLHSTLAIKDLYTDKDVAGSFLQPLRDASQRFSKELDEGGGLTDERSNGVVAELKLLDETLERVTRAVRVLS